MNESKLTYLSISLAAGALAVSTLATVLSVLPSSTRINDLEAKLETMQAKLSIAEQNRARIDELDIGLVAIVNVANLDRASLSEALAYEKARRDKPKTVPTPPSSEITALLTTTAEQENPFTLDDDSMLDSNLMSISPAAQNPLPVLSIAEVDGVLSSRISKNWYQPPRAAKNLIAVAQMKMSRDGNVLSVRISRASGNKAFDTSVINAMNAIGAISEVAQLSDADFKKAYENRLIQFTPNIGK